jgi:hypothetical protein
MAKKSLILSNEDGKVLINSTSSLSIDDVTNNLSSSVVSASAVSFGSLTPGVSILNASNGTINKFSTTNINNAPVAWNGSAWVPGQQSVTAYSGSVGGDISGLKLSI